jgi:glycosyltransferase involved in cell wall biosynthesis
MYTDLVEIFAENGHKVFPIAPSQNEEKTNIYQEKNINILRVRTLNLFNVNSIKKGIANILLPYQYKIAIKKYYSDIHFDMVLMPTPPITLIKTAKTIKKQHNAKFYLMLRDIFPQNAVDLEMISEKGFIYKYFRKQEKELYRQADFIGCMSQGNIDYVMNHNPELNRTKLHILPNFEKKGILPNKKENIKAKYGLKDKFIVVFGGNMGLPQKLENVIALAKECMEYPDVIFLLVGKGTQKRKIENFAASQGITNIVFKDFIPHDDYQQLVSQCDIGLISLNENFTIPNIPSKTLSYFNMSIPILASLDANTDYGKILETANAGLCSLAGDIKTLKANFDNLYHHPELRATMGENGRKYLEKNMTPEIAYNIITKYV